MNKRGLSDVVTTVIIIALALVAVAVVWVVVQNLISSNSSQIQSSENFLKLKMNIESVQNNSGKLFVLVKRDVGDGNFNAMKFVVIYQNQSSESFVQSASIDQLGLKGFLLNTSGSIEAVSKVEAYPTLIDSTGKQIVSTIYSSFEVNGAIKSVTCTPSCTNKACGDDGCGGSCTNTCNSTQTCSGYSCITAGCVTNLVNTSWSAWVNQTACQIDNTIIQNRSLVEYETTSCGFTNRTIWASQTISCVYNTVCTPSCTGKACGASDGCSGICQTGTCVTGTCQSGVCVVVSPGTGTASDPFKITNCVDLQNMNRNMTAYYKLMNNIDCSASVRWNGGDGFQPVGNTSIQFTGNLNGNKFVISNLVIDHYDADYNGLFGFTNNGFKVYDLGFNNIFIRARSLTGVLAGRIYGDTVDRVYAKNSIIIANGDYAGGLIGDMRDYVDVHDVYFSGNISSTSNYVGGIVGYNENSRITNGYSLGNYSASAAFIGGISGRSAGNLNSESLKNVFSVSNLYVGSSYKGGIVGYIDGGSNVIRSYWNTSTSNSVCSNGAAPVSCFPITDNTYFYNMNNQPLIGFDTSIWQQNSNTYPTLTF